MSKHAISLGCRLNRYESGIIKGHINAADLDNTFVVNSCAVTTEAVRQSRQAIRRLRRDNPSATLIATGCAAQINPGEFSDMEEVDFVFGNQEKMQASRFRALAAGDSPRIQVSNIMEATRESGVAQPLPDFSERVRAFLQVQNGCNHRCTFCVIPFGRGNARSTPPEEVAMRMRELIHKGFVEITLTGVDLTSYGQDLDPTMCLGDLLAHLLDAVPEARRLRLSSLDAIEIDPLALDLIGSDERLLPHVHLSLQSGDDLILKRMKRRHSRKDAVDLCDRLRGLRGGIIFGADLIAGFPTETDAMFRQTERLVEECGLTWLHVFAFSPRPGTPAARMPQIPSTQIYERARRLRELGESAAHRYARSLIGTSQEVVIESSTRARNGQYALIEIPEGDAIAGCVMHVRINAMRGSTPVGAIES